MSFIDGPNFFASLNVPNNIGTSRASVTSTPVRSTQYLGLIQLSQEIGDIQPTLTGTFGDLVEEVMRIEDSDIFLTNSKNTPS